MNGCQDSIPYASSCNLKMSKAETFRGGGILQFGPHQLLVHIKLSVIWQCHKVCNLRMSKVVDTLRPPTIARSYHIVCDLQTAFAALRLFWPPPSLSWSSLCFSREYPFILKMVMWCLIIFLLLSDCSYISSFQAPRPFGILYKAIKTNIAEKITPG